MSRRRRTEALPSLSSRGHLLSAHRQLTWARTGGAACLPTPSSTAPLLKAAADAVQEQGRPQGALGDEQAGRCNRWTDGGSSCLPRQDVLDCLSLLLCSRELLGHVTGCVAEEASLGYRNLEEPNFVNKTQQEVALLDHKCGHRTTLETAP